MESLNADDKATKPLLPALFSEDRSDDCMSELTDIDAEAIPFPQWTRCGHLPSADYILQPGVCMQSAYNIICSTAALLSTHTHMQQISVAGVDHCCLPSELQSRESWCKWEMLSSFFLPPRGYKVEGGERINTLREYTSSWN
jgi:hypothetical protein